MSGRLVAPITQTPASPPKPSISTSSWFSVCSRSSLPWPTPAPRLRPAASSSSMKMIDGAALRALAKRSRMRAAPTPTSDSTNSAPEAREEGGVGLPGGGPRQQRLAGPGRADQQHALRRGGAHRQVFGGVVEEVADLLQLGQGFAGAGDRVEGDRAFLPFLRFLPLPPKTEKEPTPPVASAVWRMKKAKRQTRIRIGSRNWTTTTRSDLPDWGSTLTRAPPSVSSATICWVAASEAG